MAASMFRLLGPFVAYLLAASCFIEWIGDAYTWPVAFVLGLGGLAVLIGGAIWMDSKL